MTTRQKLCYMIKDMREMKSLIDEDVKDSKLAKNQFDDIRLQIVNGLNQLRDDVQRLKEFELLEGNKITAIRMRSENATKIKAYGNMIVEMKKIVDREDKKNSEVNIVNKKKMIVLLWKELEYIERQNTHENVRKKIQKDSFDDLYEKHQSYNFKDDSNSQEFMCELKVSLTEQDAMLDKILKGVIELENIAKDMNHELRIQVDRIKELDNKMNGVGDKFNEGNNRLDEVFEERCRVSRWCPLMLLLIIILCLGGVIISEL